MISIRVRYVGVLGSVVGKVEENLMVRHGTTPTVVARHLADVYGYEAERLLFDSRGNLRVSVAVDGRLADVSRELGSGETLAFVPPLSGG